MIIKPLEFENCDFSEIQAAKPIHGITYNVKQTPTGWAWRCNGEFYKDVDTEFMAKECCNMHWRGNLSNAFV